MHNKKNAEARARKAHEEKLLKAEVIRKEEAAQEAKRKAKREYIIQEEIKMKNEIRRLGQDRLDFSQKGMIAIPTELYRGHNAQKSLPYAVLTLMIKDSSLYRLIYYILL